jgi:phosphoglycolate phosphatase
MDPQRIRASVSNGARALVSLGLEMQEYEPSFESKRLRLLELYAEVLGTLATPYPGITNLLGQLQERGIAWGISTNKPREFTAPLLERLAIQPPPGSVVCPEDVGNRKPHPESLYRNCRDLNCAPHEAIYIGDHARDIEAGRRAGMYTIAAAYGYIEPDDDPQSWGASAHARSSHELLELILGAH